jgi:RNase H-fold protein (predicted Holliday junction resolvase)
MNVLAIDPGRDKCGVAIVSESGVLSKAVVETPTLAKFLAQLKEEFHIDRAIVGNGTNSKKVSDVVKRVLGLLPEFVDEYYTTLEARKRYFKENPPKGLARLIPVSMQVPKVPFDDYVAVILAEKYLHSLR